MFGKIGQMPVPVVVSIVGVSNHHRVLSIDHMNRAYCKCVEYIWGLGIPPSRIRLRSGGSTGVDHLAIMLYLNGIPRMENGQVVYVPFQGIDIFLPCCYSEEQGFFAMSPYQAKSAAIMNDIHQRFAIETGRDMAHDFRILLGWRKLCSVNVDMTSVGFYNRNEKVAQADHLLAMTFHAGNVPLDGGTAHTWKLSPAQKTHLTI